MKFDPNKTNGYLMPDGYIGVIMAPQVAQLIVDLLATVGGMPGTTRRLYAASFTGAMWDLGVRWDNLNATAHKEDAHCTNDGIVMRVTPYTPLTLVPKKIGER